MLGIAVGKVGRTFPAICAEVAAGAAKLIGVDEEFAPEEIEVFDDYLGARYGVPTDEAVQAILLAARTEGIVLDPVYTGKAMAGLIDLAKKGMLDRNRTTVFLHTGGSPALFAFEETFRPLAN